MKALLPVLIGFALLGGDAVGANATASHSPTPATSANIKSAAASPTRAERRKARQAQKRLQDLPRHWFGATTGLALRYAMFAGMAWLLGYVIFKRRWLLRKIVPSFPASKAVRREMGYSLRTLIIFGLVGALTVFAARQGWTQMYWKISNHGQLWFWASIGLSIIVHDAYFYWTHRLMHHRRLFRLFHRGHHLSHNPTPWAAYAFDPLEALVQAGIFPLIAFLFPLHPAAFGLVMLWQITFNVLGHTGYEYHPRWLMDTWLGKILNTPTNHAMHHETMRGNFGLYFNYWDRLMGTNHEDYENRFREVTGRQQVPVMNTAPVKDAPHKGACPPSKAN